jgi:hypothetical protein
MSECCLRNCLYYIICLGYSIVLQQQFEMKDWLLCSKVFSFNFRINKKNSNSNFVPLGLSPSLLKAVFSSALQFYFYEITLEFLTRSRFEYIQK